MKKVNYENYKNKYDEQFKTVMENSPERIDIETMRANLYGYTFTKGYADGEIPDELSMDYWKERYYENFLDDSGEVDVQAFIRESLLASDGTEGIYWPVSPQEKLILKAIDSTGDGKTAETALCVIDVHQEYEYLNRVVRFYGLQFVRQSLINGGVDCLMFKDEDGNIEEVYFDVSRRLEVGYDHYLL